MMGLICTIDNDDNSSSTAEVKQNQFEWNHVNKK